MEYGVSASICEEAYLPDLITAAQDRAFRRACKKGVDGASVGRVLTEIKEASLFQKPGKTKDQVCAEIINEWQEAFDHPDTITGITSGLNDLDRLTWGWQKENLIIIGARPSQGKTAMLLGFAKASAVEQKLPTLFMTLESSPKELIKRLACQIASADQTALRSGMADERQMTRLIPAFSKITESPIYFANCTGFNISQLQNTARAYHQDKGVKLIIVDYLQKIKPSERNEKRTYEVAQASEGLKALATELEIPIISAAQINREPEKNKGRTPVLSDLADSGQIERDADIVGLIHKTDDAHLLILAKFRDGPTGSVYLHFRRECAMFCNGIKIHDSDIDSDGRLDHD
jgi:replicative DNA helicase